MTDPLGVCSVCTHYLAPKYYSPNLTYPLHEQDFLCELAPSSQFEFATPSRVFHRTVVEKPEIFVKNKPMPPQTS